MLRFNLDNKKFEKLPECNFIDEKILETKDLQAAIVGSWKIVSNKLGLDPDTVLIGKEIKSHSDVEDRIDLLAFNMNDSSITIIELKRHKNKWQLLQSLSYAAMVATWDNEDLINAMQTDGMNDEETLKDIINNNKLSEDIKIILIAESFEPEVIITAEWLNNKYGVNIKAFIVDLYKHDNQYFVNFEQKFPLKELKDIYEKREKQKRPQTNNLTWEDIIPKLKYEFGERAIRLCLTEKEGDPSRRRFSYFRSKYDGFSWINLSFRTEYINVYIKGSPDNAEQLLKSKFSSQIDVSTWQDGLSINISSETQFEELAAWLNIGKKSNK